MDVVTDRAHGRPPYQAYAAIVGVYAGGLLLAGAALAGAAFNDLLQAGFVARVSSTHLTLPTILLV
jgi:hypothetical protein